MGEIFKFSSFERLIGIGMIELVGIRIVDYCCLINYILKVCIFVICKMVLMDVVIVDWLLGCNIDIDYWKYC